MTPALWFLLGACVVASVWALWPEPRRAIETKAATEARVPSVTIELHVHETVQVLTVVSPAALANGDRPRSPASIPVPRKALAAYRRTLELTS